MKKLDFGQTITILANVGVILGIAFLAIELNQNNELLRAQADYNYMQNRVAWRQRITFDPEYAEFTVRAQNNELETEVDWARMRADYEATFLELQWQYGQLLDGNLAEDREALIERWQGEFGRLWNAPDSQFRATWSTFRTSLRVDFVEFWEGTIFPE